MSNALRRRPAARPTAKPSATGLNTHNRWSSLANLAEEEDQLDRLSNLPDGVLLDIVGRLDITDAARTRILARRWKEIPTMLSKILLTVGPFDDEHNRGLTSDDVAWANATVLGAARSMLESRNTTSPCTINLLRLRFFLGDGAVSIGHTVANTMSTEKVSICKRLELLRLFNCDMGFLSLLQVSHPLLRELEIVRCNFEMIDLKWLPKLTMLAFSWWVSEHDPLCLGYVPLLQTLSIAHMARSRHKVLKLSELLGKATVSHLNLNFLCEKIWVKPEEPNQLLQAFHKLRHVTLTHISEECDLNWTMFILQGAPSLQELCIKVWDHPCEMIVDGEQRRNYGFSKDKKDAYASWEAPASDFKHHNLSVLRVFGFRCEEKVANCVESVMKASAALEDVYLYEKPVCEYCEHTARKGIYVQRRSQLAMLANILDMGIISRVRIHLPGSSTA